MNTINIEEERCPGGYNLTFLQALTAMNDGEMLARKDHPVCSAVFRRPEDRVESDIIDRIKTIPQAVKDKVIGVKFPITFEASYAIIDVDCFIRPYVFGQKDVDSSDWGIVKF